VKFVAAVRLLLFRRRMQANPDDDETRRRRNLVVLCFVRLVVGKETRPEERRVAIPN
jgi:hypothetical protein